MPVPLENAVALGRIGGPLLAENLVRKNTGVGEQNLAFHNVSDTDNILFLNVIDGKVGINNGNPQEALDVTGIIHSDDYLATTSASIAKFSVSTNRIINPFAGVNGKIILSPDQTLNPTIQGPRFETVNLGIDDALIENLTNNSAINLNPNGTGQAIFTTSELVVDGNLTVTGTTTWDGSYITLGSSSDDNVVFNADVNSHIIPDDNDTWDLGSALQRWNTIYVRDIIADMLYVSTSYTANGINVFLRQGNTIYVSVNGLDTNVGDHTHGTFRTIKHALSQATNGDTVVIFPGTYEEIFPLTVPQGVTVNGAGIRAVTVKPTAGTKTNNAFLLNGETTVSNLTVKDFYAPGNAFSFAASFTVSTRSPYIQNVSVITAELPAETASGITVGPSPTGISLTSNSVTLSKTFYSQTLVNSLVGQIAVIDRYPAAPLFYTVVSIETEPLSPTEWRMTVDTTFNPVGQLKPISFYPDVELTQIITTDIWATTGNSVGEKWVAYYKTGLPGFFTTLVQPGWSINVAGTVYIVDYIIEDPVNTNMWRIYVTTSLVAGVGIPIFSSPVVISQPLSAGNGALVDGSLANNASKEASMLFSNVTMIVPNAIGVHATNGARVEWLTSFTYFAEKGTYLTQGTSGFASLGLKFGAELRSIGSANIYGTYGAVADGANTLGYLISHNFAYVGAGTDFSNDPRLAIQSNEVVELNNGNIYYESTDHVGNFRIGDIFLVDQATGDVIFNAQSITFTASGNITLEGPTSSAIIDKQKVQVGNIRIYDNNIDSLTGPVNLLAQSGNTYLNTNVTVTGNTDITADVKVKGNLQLGNETTDTVTVLPFLTQDLLPDDVGGPYNLGSNSKRWNTLFLDLLDVAGAIQIANNTISTLVLGTDLELSAASTGAVKLSNSDVEITNNLTVSGLLSNSNFANIDITGLLDITGDWNQTGNALRTGNTDISGWLKVNGANIVRFEDVQISGNTITTTVGNNNLEFTANGTGIVKTNLSNVEITNNLDITGDGFFNSLEVTNLIEVTDINIDNVYIVDNTITTTGTDEDLILSANNNGVVKVTTTDVTISNNLTVANNLTADRASTFQFVEITGTTTLVGDIGQTGNTDITGDFQAGNIVVLPTSWAESGQIKLQGSTISVKPTNTDLIFLANGIGGVIFDRQIKIRSNKISNIFDINDLSLSFNNILTTEDGELLLLEDESDFLLADTKIDGDLSIIFSPNGTGNVIVDATTALAIAYGTAILEQNGEIRQNTNGTYEGFSNTGNVSFTGLYDADHNTYITAELNPGDNDNTIRLYINGSLQSYIDTNKLYSNNLHVDSVRVFDNQIVNLNNANDLKFVTTGTGVTSINGLEVSNNSITNSTNDALILQSTGTGYIKFTGSNGIVLPSGDDTERRGLPELGETRYNNARGYVEVFEGTSWVALNGGSNAATEEEIVAETNLWAFILG